MAHHKTEEENKAWLKGLPKKSLAVKVVIVSERGNILLVKPNKPTWQFPGGGVEPFEDPKDAARRELAEELTFSVNSDDLRLVGTAFRKEYDNLMLIYEYIPRVPEDIALHIQEDELEGYKFELPTRVVQHLADYYQEFWGKYADNRQDKS